MKLSLMFAAAVVSLSALSGCAASTDSAGASESDLTKAKEKVTAFSCTTKEKIDGKIETMTFKVSHLKDSKRADSEVLAEEGDDFEVFVKWEGDREYVRSLNENFGYQLKDGKMRIDGDADGFFLVELVLYENSGFEKGYFRVYNSQIGDNMYSEVTCATKEVNAPPVPKDE